jgi:hypothetical protein
MSINFTGFCFPSAVGLPGLPPLRAPMEQDPPPQLAPVAPVSLAPTHAALNARMPGYVPPSLDVPASPRSKPAPNFRPGSYPPAARAALALSQAQ